MLADINTPVVVYVFFRESAILLCEQLKDIRCSYLTGDILKQSDRQSIVDSFQNGELDVIVCSYGVGSVSC